jgi:hypothetical protein
MCELDLPENIERMRVWLRESAPEAYHGDGVSFSVIQKILIHLYRHGLSAKGAYELMVEEGGWLETKSDWDAEELFSRCTSVLPERGLYKFKMGEALPEAKAIAPIVEGKVGHIGEWQQYQDKKGNLRLRKSYINCWNAIADLGIGLRHDVFHEWYIVEGNEAWCKTGQLTDKVKRGFSETLNAGIDWARVS